MSEITTTRTFEELLPSTDPTYRTTKRKEVQLLFSDFVKKWEKNQIYLTDASALRKALDEYEMLQGGNGPGTGDDFGVIGAESYYFWLQKQIHSDQEEFLSGANKADEFAVQMQNTLLFFELSLSSISPEKQSEFLSTPLLEPYRHFLEKKFAEAKHLLTPEGEKILNILSKTSYENRVSMVEKILAEHEVDNLSFEQLLHLCGDQDEGKRKRAEQQVHEILAELAPIAENELNSVLEYKKEVDQLRNFSSPEASRFLNDDIESEVVEAMVSQVKASYSISQQFYKLKAKLLGKDTLTYAEKILKYGSLDKEYSFDEAVATVRETINVLDPVFWDIFEEFLTMGKIDVYPGKGKRGGAFCSDTTKTLPVYLMLNYTGKIREVSTLIHELGHGINAILQRKQNALNYGAVVSTAEVASTFFENVLIRKLSADLEGEELLTFRVSVLDDMVATIQRQVACFCFEQRLHKAFRAEGYLTSQKIWQLFLTSMQEYMGDAITFSEGTQYWRIYWSHIRYFFYVYSYASGDLISKSMESLLHQGKISIEQIKDFLSAGRNASPKETFLKMGIDIAQPEFWKAGLEEMQKYLSETEELAKRLGKVI